MGLAPAGRVQAHLPNGSEHHYPLIGLLPPLYPEWLGDRSFQECHQVRFAYVGGAMARGITSVAMVIALAHAGMLGFFGSAGVPLPETEKALRQLSSALDPKGLSWGVNLIHTPHDPGLEEKTVELYLTLGVRRLSAAAFTAITPSLVCFAAKGLKRHTDGSVIRPHRIFAKISRPEVAQGFMEPAPQAMLDELVRRQKLSLDEAVLARTLPMAEDITVEADSGGHTDNRPLSVLFPALAMLRDRLVQRHQYTRPIRLGAAGGISTPAAAASAFAMGAAYVLVGTAHQACVESGLSRIGKEMLGRATLSDVMMTASADLFELGGKVQVLKHGTLMGVRGNQLYQLYLQYDRLQAIPQAQRRQLEATIFNTSLEEVWAKTEAFFSANDPQKLALANKDEKFKMALVFRWYLGNSSKWAITGEPGRQADYQIWCGPAIGAFNQWCQGSFLEPLEQRTVAQVGLNLMEGAAKVTRAQQCKTFGLSVPAGAFDCRPEPLTL